MAKKLNETALAFGNSLQGLCSEVSDNLQIKTQKLDGQLIVTVPPQGTVVPVAGLLPFRDGNSVGNFAIVSRCPQRSSEVTLADLTYDKELSISESENEEVSPPLEIHLKTHVQVNSPTGAQKHTKGKKAYVLETPCDISFQPCSEEEARYAISLFNLAARREGHVLPDLLIYSKACHDSSKQTETIVYLCQKVSTTQVDVACIKTIMKVSPMISCFQGKDVHVASDGRCLPATALYEVGPGCEDNDGAQLAVELHWSPPNGFLSVPHSTASARLEVVTTQGSEKSPVVFLFQELLDLSFFVHGAQDSQSKSKDTFSVEEFLSMYAKAVKSSFGQPYHDSSANLDKTITNQSSTERAVVSSRKLTDFLDFLWMSLKSMRNIPSIKSAVSDVLRCILSKRVHPYIPSSNGTKLATFINRITAGTGPQMLHYLQLEAKEFISENNLLSTLAQLGISKIAKDLRYLYVTHDLLSRPELQPLVQSTQLGNTPRDAFLLLLQYYHALEIALSTTLCCNIPGNVLHDLTCSALQAFANGVPLARNERTPTFKVYFPSQSEGAKLLASFCRDLQPSLWKAEVRKSSGEATYAISSVPVLFGQDTKALRLGLKSFDSAFCYEVETIRVDI